MIVWVNSHSAFIMNITWCTKKKKHCDYYENYLVHKKESWKHYEHYGSPKKFLPKIMNLLGTQKNYFRDVMKLLGQPKGILRKVRSYFVNLLQNNKKFAVTLYLKSFLRTSYEGFAYFQAYWWCCDERATIHQK